MSKKPQAIHFIYIDLGQVNFMGRSPFSISKCLKPCAFM